MTINGPAPSMVGYFMNAAIDQEWEIYIKENKLDMDDCLDQLTQLLQEQLHQTLSESKITN